MIKKKAYFLIDGEGRVILYSLSDIKNFDELHYKKVEKEVDFPSEEDQESFLENFSNKQLD